MGAAFCLRNHNQRFSPIWHEWWVFGYRPTTMAPCHAPESGNATQAMTQLKTYGDIFSSSHSSGLKHPFPYVFVFADFPCAITGTVVIHEFKGQQIYSGGQR